MANKVFSFLHQQNISSPSIVDKLIVSSFVYCNQLQVKSNRHIISNTITEDQKEHFELLLVFLDIIRLEIKNFNFEVLIELFEFVISPSEKVVNGAIYTPEKIRQYITRNSLSKYSCNFDEIKAADIACGCGGFLLTLSQEIYFATDKFYKDIYRDNIYGVDIAEYSIERTKILLTLFAISQGEDETEFQFNLFIKNSLSFNLSAECAEVNALGGFDVVVGNPPYVCSRNMDNTTRKLLQNWEVAKTGHPDLYIPFFQIGIEQINLIGVLGYITVNTFIKSINGRALRSYFEVKDIELTLLNFGGEQVFQDRNTYTCVCFLRKGNGEVKYVRTTTKELEKQDLSNLNIFLYRNLNHKDGWNLVNDNLLSSFIEIIEKTGIQFKDLYETKNGIATLKNDVYKFKPTHVDDEFYYLNDNGVEYQIEREICRDIVNANKIKTPRDIDRLKEKIIFPYNQEIRIFSEDDMRTRFPNTYSYLLTKRSVLAGRDKGERDYETWYAYGRRQSMDIHAFKLFFPHICERPTFVICEDEDLLFYNGIAIVSNNLDELLVIKKLLESDLFFKYIKNTTKDYSSGYISMSRNYLKNFGVYQFNIYEKEVLLNTDNVNTYIEEVYGLI